MAQALVRQQEQVGTYEALPFLERLGLLVEQECLEREHRKQERLIRQARFKLRATVQDIDYQHPRNVKQEQIARLAQGEWISRAQNLLITGPCGSGKTIRTSPVLWDTTPVCKVTAHATTAYPDCCWH